jgi:hypothetical protein
MALTQKPVVGRRAFVSLPYVQGGAGGSLRPPKPTSCPDPLATCNNRCLIHFSRWRNRVHGPGFRLASMHCLTHSRRFTVYPPGWTPYGRAPLVLLDHSGRTVETEGQGNRWNDTEFGALIDAARGNIWPEPVTLGPSVGEKSGELVRSRRTQRRHVAGVMQLFSIHSTATLRDRERVTLKINLDVTALENAWQRIRDGPSLVVRGKEGAWLLKQLPALVGSFSGLILLGEAQGFWGSTTS